MGQQSNTGPRPMKTLLVASLIASQCITNVVAIPILGPSQPDNDFEQEKQSQAVEKALRINHCARHPLDCVEGAALSGVEHASTALSHGIVAGSEKITKVGHRVEDQMDDLKNVKNALIHGEAPEDEEHWQSYVKRESALLSKESSLLNRTETQEHILRQHNMDQDLLNAKEQESTLAKRARPPPHVSAKSAAIATVVMGTAAAGILGGTLYAGGLVAKGVGKGIHDLQHHRDDDDDDDDDHRRHHLRRAMVEEQDSGTMVKRGWGKGKVTVKPSYPATTEYTINKKTQTGIRLAGVAGLTAAAAGGTVLVLNAMKDKDHDHQLDRRSSFSDEGESLDKRSPQTLQEVSPDTPADMSSKDLKKPKKGKKPQKGKKTSNTLAVAKVKGRMSTGRKAALAAGVVGMVGAGGFLANKMLNRNGHDNKYAAIPPDSPKVTVNEEKMVIKRDLTRKTGAIKPYQPTIIKTKAKVGMGTGKKVAIGAGAVMALGGIYKGIQYFTHSQAKKSDDEQLSKRGLDQHEVPQKHRVYALKTEHLPHYENLGKKYAEHKEGVSKAQTPEEIREYINRRNRALSGGHVPITDPSLYAMKTEEFKAYQLMMQKLDGSLQGKANTNEAKTISTQGSAPSEDPIISQMKKQQNFQRLQEEKRLGKGLAALEELRREQLDPYVRQLQEIQKEQEKKSGK